ncbi:hypothetical protein ZWY2020_015176 [Hordeum vulgare]|nr:hypothetical protein ZWY2020_015176 [Hordeum vulgare]
MAKYTTPIHSRVLLQALLLLICLATTTQCRITTDGINNDKINLPHGLCAYKKFIDAYCCLARNLCYATVDQCEKNAQNLQAWWRWQPFSTYPISTSINLNFDRINNVWYAEKYLK